MTSDEINFFAQTTFRNEKRKFGIKLDDRRRHVYVIGKTGMGKTAMLENAAIQDIQAGRGMAFIDPHGEAAENLLDYVPSNRVNDVVYFNPADLDYPIAFNVMEKVEPEYRHLVASGLMGVFKKIWPDVWSARMEYILNNTVLALLEHPESTLLGINRMLGDPEFRKKVVDKVQDPVVKSFWTQEYVRYSQARGYEVEATAAIQNKIGQFIANPLVRNIIGQVKTKINVREIMDGKKILIANISKGRIGEDNSRLLGALIITKLQLAAMSRVDTPEEQRKDFYLYVDEFQNFATDAFCNILSEARKYRLNLILGNQYIGQLEEMTGSGKSTRVRDAVFGNVGTIIVFRIGAEDAEFLEREFMPEFLATDLVNLGKYNIYLKLMVDGVASHPFSAETLPPFPHPEVCYKDKIIKVSRERYATPKKIIEDKISRWVGAAESVAPAAPVASQGSQQVLYDAKCAQCQKWTKVIFPPDGTRPVFCKSCLKKREKDKNPPKPAVSVSAPAPALAQSHLTPTPQVSLKEVLENRTQSFTPARKESEVLPAGQADQKTEPRIRKEVNVDELKKVLEEALNADNKGEKS